MNSPDGLIFGSMRGLICICTNTSEHMSKLPPYFHIEVISGLPLDLGVVVRSTFRRTNSGENARVGSGNRLKAVQTVLDSQEPRALL